MRNRIKGWTDHLRRETVVLWFCVRHRQTPRRLKVILLLFALAYTVITLLIYGYAAGLDFIPDWVPILGLFDDVLLVSLAIYLVIRWVPVSIRHECRQQTDTWLENRQKSHQCRWRFSWRQWPRRKTVIPMQSAASSSPSGASTDKD